MAKTYPQVGEVIELTLNGDDPKNVPLGMVRDFGYYSDGWKHKGKTVTGTQTRRFMLVKVGYQSNLAEARKALETAHGPTPEGQWLQAFRAEYPTPDGNGPVGIADSAWAGPRGYADFPFVGSNGRPRFGWPGRGLREAWRWLVPAPVGK